MEDETQLILIEELSAACEKLYANTDNANCDAIQIMTIHKSKGLEFDHVFLPGLERATPPNSETLFRWLDRPNAFGGHDLLLAPIKSTAHDTDPLYDYLKQIENQKHDYEITRLLYVAATRAKKSLHLFATINKKPSAGSFLAKLWPLYESTIAAPASNQQFAIQQQIEKTFPLFTRIVFPSVFAKYNDNQAHRVKIDIQPHSQQARIIGTVIHELFESIAIKGKDNQYTVASRLQALGLLSNDIPAAINTINIAMHNTLTDDRGQWILSTAHRDAYCEWALSFASDDAIQHVVIDRSFIDSNDIRWIIDYKTSVPKENESLAIFLEREKENYLSQLNLYAHIVSQKEKNPIRLGLYFPLCQSWIEWAYSAAH